MLPTQTKVKKPKSAQQALSSLMRLCARAERSSGDAKRLMATWGVAEGEREGVLQQLIKERFIDDERYAEAFVRDKYRFNKWGRIKITQGLRMKGIDSETISNAMEAIDETEYLNILHDLIKAKRKSTRGKNDYEINGKLVRFAIGRGFEYSAIHQCIGTDEFED